MKFKKFYDFGAIFEWSESIGKVWLEGAEDLCIMFWVWGRMASATLKDKTFSTGKRGRGLVFGS